MKRNDAIDYRQFAVSALHLSHMAVTYAAWGRAGDRKAPDHAAKAASLRSDAKWLLDCARRKKDNLASDAPSLIEEAA